MSNNYAQVLTIQLKYVSDSISLNEATTFYYNVETSREHFHTEIYFDDQKIIDRQGDTNREGRFIIDPQDYDEGEYVLKIKTVTGSGTGSLIDELNAESVKGERTWKVIIERPKIVNIESISIHNGSVLLKWQAYQPLVLEKFLYYEIIYDGGYRTLAKIEDPHVISIYDSSLTFGTRNYQVNVITEHHIAYGRKFDFTAPPYEPDLQVDLLGDTLNIIWKQPDLYKNIRSFYVSFCCDEEGNSTNTRVNDTSFQAFVKTSFGIERNVVLAPYGHFYKYEQSFFVGKKIDTGRGLFFNPNTQSYYHFSYNTGLSERYNIDLIEQKQYNFHESSSFGAFYQMSYNGEFAYEITSSEIAELNPVSLEEVQSYNLADLLNLNERVKVSEVIVSNSNVMAITLQNDRSFVLDMNDTTLLAEFAAVGKLTLSADGNFLVGTDTLYKRENQSYVPISTLDGISNLPKGFSNTQPNRLILGKYSAIEVYDCQTLSYVSSIALPNEISFLSIDPYTNLVGGYKIRDGTFYLVDLEKKSVKTINISTALYPTYFLLNSILFSKNGFYLELTE